ncbi:hypothetical protein HYT92_00055 [Candidatus Pacearchaeota archaeon]|nr:hypothetical protein [Candidatus Pacearchaeota archaeon]
MLSFILEGWFLSILWLICLIVIWAWNVFLVASNLLGLGCLTRKWKIGLAICFIAGIITAYKGMFLGASNSGLQILLGGFLLDISAFLYAYLMLWWGFEENGNKPKEVVAENRENLEQ